MDESNGGKAAGSIFQFCLYASVLLSCYRLAGLLDWPWLDIWMPTIVASAAVVALLAIGAICMVIMDHSGD